MEYDFSKLNDREFEALAASVIEKEVEKKVEIFKAGKDGGVDGRFWIGEAKEAKGGESGHLVLGAAAGGG